MRGNLVGIAVLAGSLLMPMVSIQAADDEDLVIETASEHADELAFAQSLARLIEKYDLSPWMFTKRIVIDRETGIPHSHPVLTLNTSHVEDEVVMLSNIVHEQFHWFVLEDQKALEAAVKEIRALYPDAPDGPPEGARDLRSTYLHLVVCTLEYIALEAKLGREAAETNLLSKHYYRWVFRTVVGDRAALRKILEKHDIILP